MSKLEKYRWKLEKLGKMYDIDVSQMMDETDLFKLKRSYYKNKKECMKNENETQYRTQCEFIRRILPEVDFPTYKKVYKRVKLDNKAQYELISSISRATLSNHTLELEKSLNAALLFIHPN